MEWFYYFIEKIYQIWLDSKGIEHLKTAATKIMEELTTKEKGDLGEEYVESLLINKDFITGLAPASRTKGDVWGFKDMRTYLHVALIQVKSSEDENPPALSNEETNECNEFCKFVFDKFYNVSDIIPNEYQGKSLCVSIGYVGAKNIIDNPKIKSQYLIDYKTNIQEKSVNDNARQQCIMIHNTL